MPGSDRSYEIRCPLYGFVDLNSWERDIIAQPVFQRLRRIRQLAWTDQVYPGAMHTRFEHSLGVMHMATTMYDKVIGNSRELLRDEFKFNEDGFSQQRVRVRLAALLHDVGHAPFSHSGESLLPVKSGSVRLKHEDYSAAIIRSKLSDVIDKHPSNRNYGVKAEEVAALIEGSSGAEAALFWRGIISGQIDADRMDYLRRDSLHAGVDYGRFGWQRLLHTLVAVPDVESGEPRLGVLEGGWHAAEALILARYFMFTQVYFHKTRVVYDYHLREALKTILPGGMFPGLHEKDLEEYLKWDDWRVLGLLAAGEGGLHGERLRNRDHFREVFHTSEILDEKEEQKLAAVKDELGSLVAAERTAKQSWYKRESADIPVQEEGRVSPLSKYSPIVEKLDKIQQVRLYAKADDRSGAKKKVLSALEKWERNTGK